MKINFRVLWHWPVLIGLLLGGIALRWINLTNPPLDFHATRQLRSAVIARGIYYRWTANGLDASRRKTAVEIGKQQAVYEPPLLETIVAVTYLIAGGEYLWIARIYTTLFWICGGIALYLLSRRLTTSTPASLAALAFYLFCPFGVTASRSFQPDSFMVMWILWAIYALWRWNEEKNWAWTLGAGSLLGIAILVKSFALAILAPLIGIMIIGAGKPIKTIKNKQVWAIIAICVAIPAYYYLLSIGKRSAGFFSFWSLSFTNLLVKPRFYLAWLNTAGSVVGKSTVFISLASCLLLPGRGKQLTIGFWLGYILFGLLTPYQFSTHDYYHLILIPIVAVSLTSVFTTISVQVQQQKRIWQVLFLFVLLAYLGYQSLLVRNDLVSNDFHEEIKGWIQMGQEIPRDGRIIALTHDYGLRLAYYGLLDVSLWPYTADFQLEALRNANQNGGQLQENEFKEFFLSRIEGHEYFLVTHFGELEAQPLLKTMLYEHYPIVKQGDGYVLFDLTNPLP